MTSFAHDLAHWAHLARSTLLLAVGLIVIDHRGHQQHPSRLVVEGQGDLMRNSVSKAPVCVWGTYTTYHNGQVPEMLINQGSIQVGWNLWSHGRTRTSSPTRKSSVQIEQPRCSWFGPCLASPPTGRALSRLWPTVVIVVVSGIAAGLGLVSFCRFLGVRGSSGIADNLALAYRSGDERDCCCSSSNAGSSLFGGVGSPNFTMGIVSSTARARPLARLCRGLPP